ncbi:TPA: hypothetical protein EYP37_00265 [Candidatus Poribacteria bacterium]|nr:hypothetical protein [Candidatus Poribacteria bacterium]
MRVSNHYIILTYPFKHSFEAGEKDRRWERLEDRWFQWWRRLGGEQVRKAVDDTYFFLPYIRKLLFPEACSQDLSKIIKLPLRKWALSLPKGSVLHLTYKPKRLSQISPLTLKFELEGYNFSAGFTFEWIDLFLFPQGVGFLTFKTHLSDEELEAEKLNDFLYYIRLIHPPSMGWKLPQLLMGNHPPIQTKDLVDLLLQGVVDEEAYTETEMGQVYGERFNLFIYACVDKSEIAYEEENLPPFGDDVDRLLYELSTCTNTSDPNYIPSLKGWERMKEENIISLWDNWRGMALRDNLLFLGLRSKGFPFERLPEICENDYFHLWLLPLYQKMRLSLLAGELMRESGDLHKNLKKARRLWEEFIIFRNLYWFYELNRKPQANFLFHAFQKGLEIAPLYEFVRSEVEDLQEFYERKVERNTNLLLNFLTFIGLPIGILAELFSNVLIKSGSWRDFSLWSLLAYASIGTIYLVYRRISKRR